MPICVVGLDKALFVTQSWRIEDDLGAAEGRYQHLPFGREHLTGLKHDRVFGDLCDRRVCAIIDTLHLEEHLEHRLAALDASDAEVA